MNANAIIGKEVLDKNAIRVGKVVDIELNIPQRLIETLVVKVGLTKKIYVPMSNIETTGDRIILNITKADLEKSPISNK